ncbi:unnamed protein product [Phytomonas sp. EM1]|nr:unnamed protein product [Phytomonas sp. EM1]|eukprot:CCW60034.1 unnamed protein product [Phytomonas sp. isolate EM1]
MDIIGEESVRSIIRKQFIQDDIRSASKRILDVQVVSPYNIDQVGATDDRYKTLERIVEKVREHYREPPRDSPQSNRSDLASGTAPCLPSPAVISDHWLLCVPNSIRNHERDVVNYLGMVVAIDFRHWVEEIPTGPNVRTDVNSDTAEAAVGTEVKGFTGFYTTVSHNDLFSSNAESQHAQLAEKVYPMMESKRSTLLRGSVAMIYLLRRAVELYNIPWYSPEYLAQFSSVQDAKEALRLCFLGCREDAVTPLWMPATDERVELLLSLSQALREKQTSFYDILCACSGFIFKPRVPLSTEVDSLPCSSSPPAGFISHLLELHPRYHDVACHSTASGDIRIPVLKLSQLTVLALSQALPALWRFRGQSGLPLVSEGFSQPAWIRRIASAYHSLQSDESPPLFKDLAQLSVCCDYQIPRALRDAGLLVYADRLSDLVDRGVLLQAGGRDEGAIRLGALLATELLIDYLNERFFDTLKTKENDNACTSSGLAQVGTNSVGIQALDYALWYVGRYPSAGSESRHHLCRTIMY